MFREFLREFALEHKAEVFFGTLTFIFAVFLTIMVMVGVDWYGAALEEAREEVEDARRQEIIQLRNEYDGWCELPEHETDFSFVRAFGEFLF